MSELENFKTIYERVLKNVGLSTSNTSYVTRAKDWVNRAYLDFNGKSPWPWTMQRFSFQTIKNKTGGTVSVTLGSRIVTGIGTNFTSDDEGQSFFLRAEQVTKFIIIKVNSTTELILEQSYNLASKSDQLYVLHHKYYTLASEAQNVYDFYVQRTRLRWGDLRQFESKFADAFNRDLPFHWTRWGRDYKTRSESNGTITITQNSSIIIGSGTSFLGNVQPGDLITASEAYHVKSVDSDIQITLVEIAIATRTNVAFTSTSKGAPTILIDGAPATIANAEYLYKRRTYPLQNDDEIPNVDRQFFDVLVVGGMLYGYEYLDDDRQLNQKQLFELQIKDAVSFYDSAERPEYMEWADEAFINGDETPIR